MAVESISELNNKIIKDEKVNNESETKGIENISFKQFKVDYEQYYNEKLSTIRTEFEMDEVIYDLYDTDNYEINWDNETIELYKKK